MKPPCKILIADDDPDLVRNLKDLLEFHGFATLAAYEGVRTVELAHKERPDLILLDLKMPAGTGQSVLETLKGGLPTQRIPVIVLTAVGQPGIREEMQRLGAQDFFQKPYDSNHLLERIRTVLGLGARVVPMDRASPKD